MYEQWWLTFADPTRPEGERFLGVAMVDAQDLTGAIDEAWRLHVNPGGELSGVLLPLGAYPRAYTGKLLSPEDILLGEAEQWVTSGEVRPA